MTLALKVEEVVEEEDCYLTRIGHLFGTANDGAVLADIAVRLYFADNGAIDAHVAVALDFTDDAAMLTDVAIALNLALDRAIDPDVAIALKTALDGAVDAHVAIALDAAYYTAALADGGVTSLSLHADGEEQQEDSQFAKDIKKSLVHKSMKFKSILLNFIIKSGVWSRILDLFSVAKIRNKNESRIILNYFFSESSLFS